jgi:hypothetical protein
MRRLTPGGNAMRINTRSLLFVAVFGSVAAFGATTRQWQTGRLLDTEQQKVTEGSTTTYNSDGQEKYKRGKTDYSQNSRATTTDNVDTYEVYTIQVQDKTYIAREKLLFPWSKPANVTVGGDIKYAIEGRRLYILDDDQKEHKASITKQSVSQ